MDIELLTTTGSYGRRTESLLGMEHLGEPIHSEGDLHRLTYQEPEGGSTRMFVLLPGIVPSGRYFYGSLGEKLVEESGVLLVEFSSRRFDEELLFAQIYDFIDVQQPRELNFIGASLGVRCIADLFVRNLELQSRTNHVFLLGPVLSFRDMFAVDFRRGSGNLEKIVGNRNVSGGLKSLFRYDIEPYRKEITLRKMMDLVSSEAFSSRVRYFAEPFDFIGELNVPTNVVWWTDEKVLEGIKGRVRSLFCTSWMQDHQLSGIHGHVETHSEEIYEIIRSALHGYDDEEFSEIQQEL